MDKLYSRLQIEVMNLPYGVTMEYRNGLGIVLNYSDQPYKFALPQGAKVLIAPRLNDCTAIATPIK